MVHVFEDAPQFPQIPCAEEIYNFIRTSQYNIDLTCALKQEKMNEKPNEENVMTRKRYLSRSLCIDGIKSVKSSPRA